MSFLNPHVISQSSWHFSILMAFLNPCVIYQPLCNLIILMSFLNPRVISQSSCNFSILMVSSLLFFSLPFLVSFFVLMFFLLHFYFSFLDVFLIVILTFSSFYDKPVFTQIFSCNNIFLLPSFPTFLSFSFALLFLPHFPSDILNLFTLFTFVTQPMGYCTDFFSFFLLLY